MELLSESVTADATVAMQRPRLDAAIALKLIAAGTGVGFLTGLFGVGGGFVIVPALVLVLGYDMTVAAGTSLLVIALNSLIALAQRAAATRSRGMPSSSSASPQCPASSSAHG